MVVIPKNKYNAFINENSKFNIIVIKKYIDVENKNQPNNNIINNNPAIIIVPIALLLIIKPF
jgi:hypothetical protein